MFQGQFRHRITVSGSVSRNPRIIALEAGIKCNYRFSGTPSMITVFINLPGYGIRVNSGTGLRYQGQFRKIHQYRFRVPGKMFLYVFRAAEHDYGAVTVSGSIQTQDYGIRVSFAKSTNYRFRGRDKVYL